jgi:glycosyltransferase involved in cell wall biosynthesis
MKNLKVAIVHDYIKEFGGAERVLEALCEIYPDAPIYTAFVDKSGSAYERFKNKRIVSSWFNILPFAGKLASPLRFLTPFIWGSFNFKDYDVVISSASWFITKGFGEEDKPVEICYCHTPPRWLYGYTTSVNFQKYVLVRVYAAIVGHFLRMYDFKQAQKVNFFIANSKEVQKRIQKFYKRDSIVIYPPVSLPTKKIIKASKDYYFIVSRIVGAKGLDLAVEAAKKAGFKLKIAGSPAGYYFEYDKLSSKASENIEFLGQVSDAELAKLYSGAKAFLALAKDEDFGITPVEAQSFGTPVIAFNGGGYKETVLEGKTGILFDNYSEDGLIDAIRRFEKSKFDSGEMKNNAEKFSKETFKQEILQFVESHVK